MTTNQTIERFLLDPELKGSYIKTANDDYSFSKLFEPSHGLIATVPTILPSRDRLPNMDSDFTVSKRNRILD